ncbi:MAG: 4Fe-4S binding protein [Thaumarchaeota archaeon]|nr:4Fe-4S binding protein [Nitrososphaerota archaeon]
MFTVPQAVGHGYYSATANGYDLMLFTDPTEAVAGQPTDIMFYVSNKATGRTVDILSAKASVEHEMDGMTHLMDIDATPRMKIYYGFSSTFSKEGWNPIKITAEIEGKSIQFEVEVHILPATEGGTSTTTMPGMPSWLIPASAGVAVVGTVVMIAVIGRRSGVSNRSLDLLSFRSLAWLVKKRSFPALFRVPSVLVFMVVILTGLFGLQTGYRNFSTVMTWVIWWILLIPLTLFLGKIFCLICPIRAVGEWTQRAALAVSPQGLRLLNRNWPRRLKTPLIALGLLLFLTWLEIGYGVTRNPIATSYLALGMVALAVSAALFFRRDYFCRYLCPIGLMNGVYSLFSPLELRARDKEICHECKTKDCLLGNASSPPCPTYQYLGAMSESTDCLLCTECVRSCPKDNVAINLRPFASDLSHSSNPRFYVAVSIVALMALNSFHGVTMIPLWYQTVISTSGQLGLLGSFTAWMLLFFATVFGVVTLFICLTKLLSRDKEGSIRRMFSVYAYSLIPVALLYHLAHNVSHFSSEAGFLVSVLSDPFGWGWNFLGNASRGAGPLLGMHDVWYLQIALLIVGHLAGVYVAWITSRRLFATQSHSFRAFLPIVFLIFLFTVFSLWLTAQPMLMKTAL